VLQESCRTNNKDHRSLPTIEMMSESDIDINMDKSMAIGHSSPTHQKRQISNFELATSEPAGRVTVGRSSAARRANIPSLRTREINQNGAP